MRIAKGLTAVLLSLVAAAATPAARAAGKERHLLYVAVPGIRNYVEYGGTGILVYDADAGHKLVRRIPTFAASEKPEAIKGIAASAAPPRVFLTTPTRMLAMDLMTGKAVWEKPCEGGCDRLAIAPDGKVLYVPSFEGPHWNVIDAATGAAVQRIQTNSGAHNTVYGPDGRRVYLAGLKSPLLFVADTATHTVAATVGPFSASIRPFTINGAQTLAFVNVNDLLGFEVGDLRTGKKLHRVEVAGATRGPVKRHGCPSHGIALTPDEKEVWVTDGANSALHVFDATVMPPRQVARVALRDQPGWITFSMDGRFAYASTGEVIDPRTRKIVATLADESGKPVHSEKVVEVVVNAQGKPVRVGDQFGIGRKGSGR